MTITRIGFIGLGNMGSPMAAHLADAGFAMTVSDAAPGVTEGFVAAHPTSIAAAGARSFATADALILMLPTSEIVEDVLEGDKVADALPPGCLVSTELSDTAHPQAVAARLQAGACRCSTPRSQAVYAEPERQVVRPRRRFAGSDPGDTRLDAMAATIFGSAT
jgi:3-hydroxyisobutyrate dehydrogenase